jgi:tetratricopeptide (TPR) repeat protein
MKKHLILIGLISIAVTQCKSGLVTMSNGCYDLISQGQAQNKAGNYSAALDNFNKVLQKCDAYDAKEKAYAGKAAALNGMGQYSDAQEVATNGLNINKNSLDNLFEKVNAEMGIGNYSGARADLNAMMQLTARNQNITQRATLYAKLAEVDMRQQQFDQALQDIRQAMSLDNSNLHFLMQQGDIHVAADNYPAAIDSYTEAISRGKNDAEAWKAKTTTLIKLYQQKYKTSDAGTLAKKINSADRQTLCNAIGSSKQAGVQDMGIDLVQVSICK